MIFFLLFLSFPFCFTTEPQKIPINLYYEVLCPGSQTYINSCLSQFFTHTSLLNISNLQLFPFGNAQVISRNPPQFSCQHGVEECYGNTIEACAILKYSREQWFPFVGCLESKGKHLVEFIDECAKNVGINPDELKSCAKSEEGSKALLQMADNTPKDLLYVPWLVIGEEAVGESMYDVVSKLCEKYEGDKPEECQTFACHKPNEMTYSSKNTLNVYMESLCPDCVRYIDVQLAALFPDKETMKYLNISLIPFGNAHIVSENPIVIKCQHNEKECYGNRILGCAIHLYPDYELHYPFVDCLESQYYKLTENATIKECAKKSNFDFERIMHCSLSDEGQRIHLENGKLTPVHKTVPHVLLNNKQVDEEADIYSYICPILPEPKPKRCTERR